VVKHGGTGSLRGAEAVIDKDLTASLLARQLHADALLLLTDVDAVQDDYGTPRARAIHMAAIGQLADAQALLERRAGTVIEP
jgi:carbamate kinase